MLFLFSIEEYKIIGRIIMLFNTPIEIVFFLPKILEAIPKNGPPKAHPIKIILMASVLSMEEKPFTFVR